jgi:hypothetical protein
MRSTELHEDYVFVTKSHDHAASDAVWVVKRYEPEQHLVQFYKVEPGKKLGGIEVQCSELNESLTKGWTRQIVKNTTRKSDDSRLLSSMKTICKLFRGLSKKSTM